MKKEAHFQTGSEKPLWLRCSSCKEFIYRRIFEKNLKVCPVCGFHYRISSVERIEIVFDGGRSGFREMFSDITSDDVLGFNAGEISYEVQLHENRRKTGLNEAVITGTGFVEGVEIAAAVFDFDFMGGSMGSGVGEKIVKLFEHASEKNLPVVVFPASGGARMQEGLFSLYQMVRTVIAVEEYKRKCSKPFICIMLNPTTGGVLASFVSLADVLFAEPNALIGFAGPRVIEKTIGRKLPAGFQRSEFLLEKGLIDGIVKRSGIREFIRSWCKS
jgi:acetyl-CoA carboxylase carboxyl transferase subunit beta